jgi:hypothetical protein
MKRLYFTLALAVMCVFGLSGSSHSQEADAIVVKIPFDFFVGTRSMPAGRYTFERVFADQHSGFILHGDGGSTIVVPKTVDDTSTFQAKLTFEHLGDKYFLDKVKTSAGIYSIATTRPITVVAGTTDKNTVPAGGTN